MPDDLRTCGMCAHATINPDNLEQIVCFGVPPTPCVTGGRQTATGQVQYSVEHIRPMLKRAERACSLFKQRILLGTEPSD